MFDVKVICDSTAPSGRRLTTITATYPRFIHSEVMTHRDRERNAASSRAIPWTTMSRNIADYPVVPIKWGREQKGMQTGDEIDEALRPLARAIWLKARDQADLHASMLHNIGEIAFSGYWDSVTGYLSAEEQRALQEWAAKADSVALRQHVHKSLPNRLVEPWMWITVVMTATEWKNFFRLRCHPDAEVHFQKIAGMIRDALAASRPLPLNADEWHLPFVSLKDGCTEIEEACRVSVARCARVSYLTHEGLRDKAKDLELYDRLVEGSGFGHWSPHGHVARAETTPLRSGPFVGWTQFRKLQPGENEEG